MPSTHERSVRGTLMKSVDFDRLKIDGLPFAFDNPGANLGWRFLQLHLPIRVENFLHADSAVSPMRGPDCAELYPQLGMPSTHERSVHGTLMKSVDSGRLKIDGLPFAFDNPCANLGWRFLQLHLPIRVENAS